MSDNMQQRQRQRQTNRRRALLERIAAEQATAKPTRLKKAVTADG